jgi:hypothetical protein
MTNQEIKDQILADMTTLEKKLIDFASDNVLLTNEDQASLQVEITRIKEDISSLQVPATGN